MIYFASGMDKVHWVVNGTGPKKQVIGNNVIYLTRSSKTIGRSGYLLSRFFSILKYTTARKVLRSSKVDIILINDGIIEGIIGFILAKKNKKKFAFYLSSHFLDMDFNEFITSPSFFSFLNLMKSLLAHPFILFLIKNSDFFHPISEAMGRYYGKTIPNKVYPLPLCPAKSFLEKDPSTHKNIKKFDMVYIGQVTPVRKIDFLVDIAKELKFFTDKPFRIRIIGKIYRKSYKKKLEKKISRYSLMNEVELLGEVPFENVSNIITQSDLGLSILPPILAYRISSPTKVVEYLSLGLPVVGNREIEDQCQLIEKSGGGISPPYSKTDITSAILTLMANENDLKYLGEKGRLYILKNRTYEKLSKQLKEIYEMSLRKKNEVNS